MSLLVNFLAVIGGAVLLYVSFNIYEFIALHFIIPAQPLQVYKRPNNPKAFALITGSSGGIGFGTARALVTQGFNVILLAHVADKLASAQAELEKLNPRAVVRVIVMNVQTATIEEIKSMVQGFEKEGLDISILMNNVGGNPVAIPPFRLHETYSCEDVDACIDMNARFMARLTALMIPILKKSATSASQRSLILNVSSAGRAGCQWLAMYSATKAFNFSLSVSLAREFELQDSTKHLDCLCIVPGDVRSEGNCRAVPPSAPTSDLYGENIVKLTDGAISQKLRWLTPYWLHHLQLAISTWLPEETITREFMKMIKTKKDAWDEFYGFAKKEN